MKKNFDVFVIGSGIAGQTVAKTCAKQNLKVAIADHTIYGGTCANRGCDPKKVIYTATKGVALIKNLNEKGIFNNAPINWRALQKFKQEFTNAVPASTEKDLLNLGITLYHQSPYFIDEHTLSVEGKTVNADNIVIATGLVPRSLNIEGQDFLKTSNDFLNLSTLPKSIIFIGAGYIGMEFAHMAARAGSKVTIVERGDRILKPFDEDLSQILEEASKDLGIDFVFNAEVHKVEKLKKNFRLVFQDKNANKSIKAPLILNTSGRVPALDKLKVSKIGLDVSSSGIEVNSYLQSKTHQHIYACGDVSSLGKALTPLSGQQGDIVAHNILNPNHRKSFDAEILPSNVFTIPNLASVGYSEKEARDRFKNVEVRFKTASEWFNAKHANHSHYAFKIISNKRNKRILGAHILSPNASETINLYAMAMTFNISTEDIQSFNLSYPSWAYDIKSMV